MREISGCSIHFPADIVKMHTPCRLVVLAEEVIALIWHRYPAFVWVNCAEWEVLCSSLAFGQHIKKRGFSGVDNYISTLFTTPLLYKYQTTVQCVYKTETYPTLGNPTIPIFKEVPKRPIKGGGFGASPFLGGIYVQL